jgi:hypothetical protein
MDAQGTKATQEWVERWVRLTPVLKELDRRPRGDVPLSEILPQFNDCFRAAINQHPPKPWSGLVEQQAAFRRLRQ